MHSSKYSTSAIGFVVCMYVQAITCGTEVIIKVNGIRLHLSWNSHSRWHVRGALNAISQILKHISCKVEKLVSTD